MLTRNIWDHADYHCPIVGTCISTAELRKLAARLNLALPPGATDFELHGAFVTLVKRPERPARVVQKFLDRKFKRQLRRFAKVKNDDEAWALWTEMADAGDIPGAFWAIMRMSVPSAALLAQVYGEVHMLSHLVGASTRADLRRLAEAEARAAKFEAMLVERRNTLREAVAVWKRRTLGLEREVSVERARREAVERERVSLREVVATSGIAALESDRAALLAQLERLEARLADATAQVRRQTAVIETKCREEATLRAALKSRDTELEALESALAAAPHPCGGTCDDPSACPCPRLRGKCVLYVGGRSGMRSQYQQMGERFGCELLHHDGGQEQSPRRLQQLLARADAVVCPVDCVSHDACALVKRLCRASAKPVHFARSSGLSSLVSSLTHLDRACQ
jgi:hypothetical protein